jgi:hypothetical protein
MTDKCRTVQEHEDDCMDFFENMGRTIWTVDEAKSIECFHEGKFCFVGEAFADELTARKYLTDRFGGIIYNPANIPTTVDPL